MSGLRGVLTALLLCFSATAGLAQAEGQIIVTGEGSAFAVPDMAVITMGATAEAETAKAAMDQTSDITAAILARLEEFEVASRDVQTSDLSLNPVWSNRAETNGRPRIEGYQASNRVTVRIRDLATGQDLADAIPDTRGEIVWARDGRTLFYVRLDAHHAAHHASHTSHVVMVVMVMVVFRLGWLFDDD